MPSTRAFAAGTGITLKSTCGIDTSGYDGQWRGVCPRVEIVMANFTDRAAPCIAPVTAHATVDERINHGGQLTLLGL